MFNFKKSESYAKWFAGNIASGGAAGASSLLFVYSLDYARTRLANDNKSAKKGGSRQFNGLVSVYKQTLATDGIAGLYRGFVPSVVGIIVYRGLYFGLCEYRVSLSFLLKPTCLPQQPPRRRLFEARRPPGTFGGILLGLVLARLGSYHRCRSRFLPLGHHQATNDDDLGRYRSPLQEHVRRWFPDHCQGGSQVLVQGSWCREYSRDYVTPRTETHVDLCCYSLQNILRGVAGAGVLSLYDKLQELMFGKVYSGGSG